MTGSPEYDAWIQQARGRRIEEIARRRGIKLKGKAEHTGPCPRCGGTDRFSINTRKQLWNCRGCQRGGDVIAFVEHFDGTDFNTACAVLMGQPPLRAKPNGSGERREASNDAADGMDDSVCLMPVPSDAGPPIEPKVKGRAPDSRFTYRDARGGVLGCISRWEARDGDRKEFRPVTYWRDGNGRCEWKVKTWPAGERPLYGLDRLAKHPDATVLLGEGEKTADAVEFGPLAEAFKWCGQNVIGVTWPGGGNALKQVDFSPLAGRDVIVPPDDHPEGENTADMLVKILQRIGVRSLRRWKAPPEAKQVKDAWDIADAIPPGWTPEALAKAIIDAPQVTPRIVQSLSEFLATLPTPDYVIDGLFQHGHLYSITAKTGAGKTAVALLLGALVADPRNRQKLGDRDVEHGRVLYVTKENAFDVKMRLVGMSAKMGFEPAQFDSTFLVIEKIDDLESDYERIRREVAAVGNVDLVFLDTSAALFVGDDENNPIQMLKHARSQRKLCDLSGRPCVIALNHPIKSAQSPDHLLPRGGGGYLNEIDGNFTLWARADRLTDLHWTGKLRGPDFEEITFRLETVNTTRLRDSKGRMMPTVMAQLASEEDIADAEQKATFQDNRLLAAIRARPEGSIAELAVDCGWYLPQKNDLAKRPNRPMVQRVLKRLLKAKLLNKEGHRHVLTKAGKAAGDA